MAESVGTHEERELKFDVPDGYELPDLSDVTPAQSKVTRVTVRLTSTYYDTAAHDLLRHRITLRRREGDTDTGWHLKIPSGLARTEIHAPLGAGRRVPVRLTRLIRGITLGDPLVTVAVVETERRLVRVKDGHGKLMVEVADDQVHATTTGDPARVTQWREVEVELGDAEVAGDGLLATFAKALQDAGATESASRSKLGHALGEDTDQTAAATPETAAAAMTAYLSGQFAALTAGDLALRRGLDAVHRTRVAARRARSVLCVFAPVFAGAPGDEAAALVDELSWYQDLLGEVRDRQVQREVLVNAVEKLPAELALGPIGPHLEQTLSAEEAKAFQDVRAALDSERYLQLLRRLSTFIAGPTVASGTGKGDLKRLARDARHTAVKRLAKATGGEDVDPVLLQRARRAVKRARYATELVAPISGDGAEKAIERHEDAQELLGEHQDAVVAAENLHRIGRATGSRPGHNGFTYGLLYERQLAQQQRLRSRIAKFDL